MIEVKPIASSSAGNCIWISDGTTPLLLDCGIPIKLIREATGHRLSEVAGCLVSHEHGDHAKSCHDLIRYGVTMCVSRGTGQALGMKISHQVKVVVAKKQFSLGTWTVLPFPTVHDAAEPLGYLMQSGRFKVLWATDTAFIQHRFNGLTHILVECNYDADSLVASCREGRITRTQHDRVVETHFGLANVVDFLRANDLSAVQEIHLLHLSDSNSNEELMVETIQRQFGIPVFVAKK